MPTINGGSSKDEIAQEVARLGKARRLRFWSRRRTGDSIAPTVISTGFGDVMAAITVRGLRDEIHRALKARAAGHGVSTEAEVRAILEAAVSPPDRVQLGSLLAEIGREAGGVDLNIARDRTPAEPVEFS